MIYFFNVLFCDSVLSYFAKPNFIVYDEWFDDDLKKITPVDKNKKIKTISNTHEFFYEQSNYKVGASENNVHIEIDINRKELFNSYSFVNNSYKYASLLNKKFVFFKKLSENKPKFYITKKIYSFTIIGLVFILGLLLFSISQTKKNESYNTNNSTLSEKEL